ncbi:hypothetical protein GCM10010451_30690 [Streptomyces virens]|uniref:Uncharacterized protein n=2 Tax=Streptomyces TaxID=1883 RepID=A0AA40SJI2_9ACTN|nr:MULTISPECIES: hypothetical protein [Streptomyces]MBA8947423.1 hypothetical protein [Streptomyces calvus]MBA8979240.1 hypothetical protein [Streptomyces calvus]MYS31120.1 hypothetical protein [Streptomyces sp. SID7804]GGP71756.1 hypothetical protein GCM10010247_51250 [Streptomyces calvus]
MAARTHTRPHPAPRGGVDTRLPWWALALPTLAFLALLALILHPAEAHATAGEPAISDLVERAQQLIAR